MKTKLNNLLQNQAYTTWCSLPALAACLLLVLSSGCQHEKAAAQINPVGNYALLSVDGNKVPCTVQHEGHTLKIESGMFAINADGTCSSKMNFVPPTGREVTRDVHATYTRQGSQLTMKWDGAGMTTGTIEADTFTMNNEGMILRYQR